MCTDIWWNRGIERGKKEEKYGDGDKREIIFDAYQYFGLFALEYPVDQMDKMLSSGWPVSAQGSGLMRMPVYGVTDRG